MSTPPEPGQRAKRPVLEPTYVVRRRRTEALAQLVREMERDKDEADPDEGYESVQVAPERILPPPEEYETQQLPPVPGGEDYASDALPGDGRRAGRRATRRGNGPVLRRAAIAVAVGAAALIGFGFALLVPGGDTEKEARATTPSPPTTAPAAPPPARAADPDGPGTLREGDTGPQVTELQQRLLEIPNVYENGSTDGRYDSTLTEAVARFQLWYGIRGDETGVYGNDTRLDLESRTTP
ncbi:peptidoglycan-binding domain-containing protein [Streptomyces sp. NPDC002845]